MPLLLELWLLCSLLVTMAIVAAVASLRPALPPFPVEPALKAIANKRYPKLAQIPLGTLARLNPGIVKGK